MKQQNIETILATAIFLFALTTCRCRQKLSNIQLLFVVYLPITAFIINNNELYFSK